MDTLLKSVVQSRSTVQRPVPGLGQPATTVDGDDSEGDVARGGRTLKLSSWRPDGCTALYQSFDKRALNTVKVRRFGIPGRKLQA